MSLRVTQIADRAWRASLVSVHENKSDVAASLFGGLMALMIRLGARRLRDDEVEMVREARPAQKGDAGKEFARKSIESRERGRRKPC